MAVDPVLQPISLVFDSGVDHFHLSGGFKNPEKNRSRPHWVLIFVALRIPDLLRRYFFVNHLQSFAAHNRAD
jgi:hypothetical protein